MTTEWVTVPRDELELAIQCIDRNMHHQWEKVADAAQILRNVLAEAVEADDTADQLNVLYAVPPSPPRDEVVEALKAIPQGAIDALRNNQRQLDMDGVEVGVSRQAIDEVLVGIDAALQKLEGQS